MIKQQQEDTICYQQMLIAERYNQQMKLFKVYSYFHFKQLGDRNVYALFD